MLPTDTKLLAEELDWLFQQRDCIYYHKPTIQSAVNQGRLQIITPSIDLWKNCHESDYYDSTATISLLSNTTFFLQLLQFQAIMHHEKTQQTAVPEAVAKGRGVCGGSSNAMINVTEWIIQAKNSFEKWKVTSTSTGQPLQEGSSSLRYLIATTEMSETEKDVEMITIQNLKHRLSLSTATTRNGGNNSYHNSTDWVLIQILQWCMLTFLFVGFFCCGRSSKRSFKSKSSQS